MLLPSAAVIGSQKLQRRQGEGQSVPCLPLPTPAGLPRDVGAAGPPAATRAGAGIYFEGQKSCAGFSKVVLKLRRAVVVFHAGLDWNKRSPTCHMHSAYSHISARQGDGVCMYTSRVRF